MEVPCRPEGSDDRESILAEKPGPLPKAAINSLSRIFDLLPSPDPPPDPPWMDAFQYPAGMPSEAHVQKQSTKTIPLPISSVEALEFDPSWIRRNGQTKYISVKCVAHVDFDIDKLKLLSTSGRVFAHSTLRNLDDISGINGSSQLHRPYELKFLNATLLRVTDERNEINILAVVTINPRANTRQLEKLQFCEWGLWKLRNLQMTYSSNKFFSINIWCGIVDNQIIGPYFIDGTLNSDTKDF
ncbi:hypothetical protein ALC62_12780 [Cyphomyrmex costatus]|uniref:Uncharacterized protein n=1 Tax=Cyphomyrmex costatus TaxID=456900 RepID=A0A151IAS8_9HYME|nr:hypothetical protein ALC62_12780 [Cyphomyrmex costatus]